MRRTTFLFACALAVCSAAPLLAQPTPTPVNGRVLIPLTLHPTAAPKPASRVYLLPEYSEMVPGNRVQKFLWCFMEQDSFFGREETERRDKWGALPLAELPPETNNYGHRVPKNIGEAARMTQVDWQLWFDLRRDGIGTLLPDVQKMRQLGLVMKLRLRSEIKARDFDAAIESIKTMFGMAVTLDAHPTLIGHLVGLAIAAMACEAIEEMIQQPGCPNLFWALTDLPSPLLNMRKGIQGERLLCSEPMKPLLKANAPLADAELAKLMTHVNQFVSMEGGDRTILGVPLRYAAWATDPKRVELARKRLVETGFKPSVAAALPPLQAIIADDFRQYEVYRDELFKWVNVPASQGDGMQAVENELAQAKRDGSLLLAPMMVASIAKVKAARTRVDQRIAYLRIIEAVRLYAHEHGEKLPESLATMSYPLPLDPVTGKSFVYVLKDGFATLSGGNPTPITPQTNREYELRLKK